MLEDAKLLRNYAVKKDRNGQDVVYNPMVLDKALARISAILTNAIRLSREVIDKNAMESFFAAVYWAIAQESPIAQRRIIDRLTVIGSPLVDIVQKRKPPIDV
jgi:hypothetical protein